MRYKHLLSEEQLDELRMSPSSLRQFASSPEAEGIQAGFEAELVFTGLGEPGYDEDPEPDYDADERCRSLDGVVEFFQNDEYGYGLSDRQADRLRESLDEMYYEWYDGQMFDQWSDDRQELIRDHFLEEQPWTERLHAMLVDGMELSDDQADKIIEFGEARKNGTLDKKGSEYSEEELDMLSQYNEAVSGAEEILDEEVENCIAKEDKTYDSVLDDFRDNFYINDDSGFFSDVGLRWMSDVANEFDLMWPVITYTGGGEGGFNEDNAHNLADSLEKELGVKTKVSSGYHSATRTANTWIFEPDSSLDADDSENMPVEIVSPPMPLKDCLEKMEQFFEWAESNGAYANSSTGFHMGVSLPHRGGAVDYLKLALFLGDEHVLDEFGRRANHFCEAAMKKIRQRVRSGEKVGDALDLMKNNLIELAAKQLGINPHGFGKYTSINPKGGNDSTRPEKERGAEYIEFRSAGGSNYFEDIDKLKNTLLRYAKAMTVAANPAAERKEYYKKLYKLISPPEGDASMDLFSRFATGSISADELKKQWAEKALEKDAPELVGKGNWVVVDQGNFRPVLGQEYNGYTRDEVRARAKQKLSPASSDTDFDMAYSIEPKETGQWEVYSFDPDTDEENTLEIVDADNRGQAVDKVYDKYNDQRIPFKVRPYYGGEKKPEPKLSRRAELAKRIKAPKPNWNVVYRPTGRVIDTIINVSREEAQKLLPKVAKQHDFSSVDDLELHNQSDTERAQTKADRDRASDWEAYRVETGNRIDTLAHADADQAEAWRRDIVRRYSHPDSSVAVRRVGEDEPDVSQNFNRQSNNPNPTAPIEGQVRMPNGVPVWELVDIDSGHVLHAIADHTSREAYREGMAWLRSYGAENPETYGERFYIRPKMLQPGERNQSPTIREAIDPVSGAGAVPPRPQLKRPTTPRVKPITPAVKVDIGNRQPDPMAQTYAPQKAQDRAKMTRDIQQARRLGDSRIANRVFEEFDAYFESVITPAKKKLK